MSLSFFDLIDRLLGRTPTESSKDMAKDRLRLVLMHDRADIPAPLMEQMRQELIELLSKYVEIDQEALEVALESDHSTVALIANIPIKRVLNQAPVQQVPVETAS